jgi:hypothetical protein
MFRHITLTYIPYYQPLRATFTRGHELVHNLSWCTLLYKIKYEVYHDFDNQVLKRAKYHTTRTLNTFVIHWALTSFGVV